MKTKKIVLWCIIVFLFVLPFAIRHFRGNSYKMMENDGYAQAERFVALHLERVNERIESLKKQTLDDSFAGLLDDQQYSYPGFHSELFNGPEDMERLLSTRCFLKVFQQFGALPRNQAVEKLNVFCKRAINDFSAFVEKMSYSEDPLSVPAPLPSTPQTSLMGVKYMVCTTMLLAARMGENRLLINQIDEMQRIIDKCVRRFNENDAVPPSFVRTLPHLLSLEDDCILSVLIYASKRTSIDVKTDIPLESLNQKTIPLFQWDAEVTYYDILTQRGYQKIDVKNAVEEIVVSSFSINDMFDVSKKKSIINTLKERLSK